MRLKGKYAIITGGGSGLGFGIARRFVLEGANVALVGRSPDKLSASAHQIQTGQTQVLAIPCDVTDETQVQEMVSKVVQAFGTVNVVVNCAGVRGSVGTVVEMDLKGWWEAFRVNTTGPLLVARYVIPHMVKAGGGSIINIGSMRLHHVKPGAAAYCASKGALAYLTKVMALDHAHQGIRVNLINPGLVLTPFTEYVVKEAPTPEEGIRRYASQYPLGRIGTLEDIAWAAVYLASEDSAWVTGAQLDVDGGMSAL